MPTAWGLVPKDWFSFGSEHPNVVHFCMADGSVKRVSTNVDLTNFIWVGGRHDGMKVSDESIQ
jgi:prepilin-type processing-associated H-X9-DG protein